MNAYEMQARTLKAAKLVNHLRRSGIGYEAAQMLREDQWKIYANGAGLKTPPSAETRRMVLEMLKEGQP
jgi:hypothetical protein